MLFELLLHRLILLYPNRFVSQTSDELLVVLDVVGQIVIDVELLLLGEQPGASQRVGWQRFRLRILDDLLQLISVRIKHTAVHSIEAVVPSTRQLINIDLPKSRVRRVRERKYTLLIDDTQ